MSVTISANAWTAVQHHPPATASAGRYVLAEGALDVAQFELTATQSPAYAYVGLPHPCSAAWARPDRGCCASDGCTLVLRDVCWPLVAVKLESGADAGLQVGVGEAGGQRVDGAPAGAVRGDEVVGVKLGERVAGRGDDRLE